MTRQQQRGDSPTAGGPKGFGGIPFFSLLDVIRQHDPEASLYRDPDIGTPSIISLRDGFLSRIRARPVHGTSRGVSVYAVITVETDRVGGEQTHSTQELSACNAAPPVGAFILSTGFTRARAVSRFSLYRDADDVWELYGPLITAAAVLNQDVAGRALRSVHAGEPVASVTWGDPGAFGPSPWTEADVADAASWLKRTGIEHLVAPTKLIANVPWLRINESAPSEPMRFSSMRMHVNALHPILGMGMMVWVDAPIDVDSQREGEVLAWVLNDFDSRLVDGPPLVGAWHFNSGTNKVEHISFLPRALCLPGSCRSLVTWTAWRVRFAAEILREGGGELAVPVFPSL